MSTEALSSERWVSFWEIKNQEGFKSPTLQGIALNSKKNISSLCAPWSSSTLGAYNISFLVY